MLDHANPNKVAKLAEKKKQQGPLGMQCVKWHMRDGKPWRCARFRPPEKPTLGATKPKREAKPKVKKTRAKPAAKRRPAAKRKAKTK